MGGKGEEVENWLKERGKRIEGVVKWIEGNFWLNSF
jgi:hypothetical protein